MKKSYVSMEQHECIVCGRLFNTGSILMDKRLKNSLDPETVTGQSICPEHQKQLDEGYILCIEVDASSLRRLGRVVAIRALRWNDVFDTPVPPKGICLITSDLADMLSTMSETV